VTLVGQPMLDRLQGEARSFVSRARPRLAELDETDLALWVDMAEFISGQRLRDKRRFFMVSLDGLSALESRPLLRSEVHATARRFTGRSSRLGVAFMSLCRDLMPKTTADDFREIVERASALDRDVDLAGTFMHYSPAVLARRDMTYLRAWHSGALALSQVGWWAAKGYLEAAGKSAQWLHEEDLAVLAEIGAKVASRSRHAVKGLFQALPALVASMTVAQLVQWVEVGLQVTRREEDLVLYMSYGSKRSHEAVEVLCKTTSFSAFRSRIALLLEAFLGRPAQVRSMYDLLDPAGVPPDVPAFTDGERLYVRPTLGCAGVAPLALYKLVALHAAAHERFGSYGEKELELLFRRGTSVLTGRDEGPSDLDRFLFGVAEDFRVDTALLRTLPGLRADAELVVSQTYAEVMGSGAPLSPASLRAHAAAFHLGVRLLEGFDATVLEGILSGLAAPDARPADSAAVAAELKTLFGDRLLEAAETAAADIPHPPYYDHLFLGMKIASLTAGSDDPGKPGGLSPGAPVDVPGSLHPSEIIEGLEITVRDRQQEVELLIRDEEEDEDGDEEGEKFVYHEWDSVAGDFRRDWCTVRCKDIPQGDPVFVQDTISRYRGEVLLIRRQFERLRPERVRRYFRQQDGDELDLDALTEALADRAAGVQMSDKIFVRRDKKQRDVAVLFLLDMSDSTDQLVEGGERVIDVEKQGLVLLSEAVGPLNDRFAVMGFSSRGRKHVDMYRIKDFDDEFDETVERRIAGIQPFDYTRLGAAIRHATDHLSKESAAIRLLILLSDGRPYDMGYGDMRYALEDTKMALSEAVRSDTKVFCITVDPEGPRYLEDMFGANRYTVIQNVSHLPTKLPRIYGALTA